MVFSPDGRTAIAERPRLGCRRGPAARVLADGGTAAAYSADGRRILVLDRDGVRTRDATDRRRAGPADPDPVDRRGRGVLARRPAHRRRVRRPAQARAPEHGRPSDRPDPGLGAGLGQGGGGPARAHRHSSRAGLLPRRPDAGLGQRHRPHADPGLRIWDVASGKPLRRFKWGPLGAHEVAYLPHGRSIVTAGDDGTALVWDVSDLADRRPPEPPDARAFEAHWSDLASDDAPRAHRASWALGTEAAVPFLRDRLRPAAADQPAAGPEVLRTLRAIAALERIGSPPAREVVEVLERGDAGGPATRDAAEALLRLSRKKIHPPSGAAAR